MINRFGPSPETPGGASVSYPVPNPVDLVVIEQVGARPENYLPIPLDSPHPDNALTGLDLRLVWQGPTPTDPSQMRRVYATGRTAEDAYNYAIKYSAESNAAPIYVRAYLTRRDAYAPLAKGSVLTGLVGVRITSPGSGYTQATGTISTGGIVQFVVNAAGQIVSGTVTSEGVNVADGGSISITGDGTGAAATAVIQPASAVLVKEDVEKITEDIGEIRFGWHEQMLGGTYVKVTRVYETLPGPFVESTRIDPDGIVVTITTRRNIAADIVSGEFIASENVGEAWIKTTKKGDDNFVAEEVVESRVLPGNPMVSQKVEEDGVVATETKTLEVKSTIIPGDTLIGGVWTKISSEPVSDLVSNAIIYSRAIPGNPVLSASVDPDGIEVSIVKTLKASSAITPSETLISGVWQEIISEPLTALVSHEVVKTRVIPGNPMVVTKVNEDRTFTTITRTLKGHGSITSGESVAGGIWTKTYQEDPPVFRGFALRGGDLVAWEMVETREIPGNVVSSIEFERDGVVKSISKQLVETASVILSETLTANLLTRKYGQAVTALISHQIIEEISVAYDSLLDLPSLTTSIPNVIPEIFKALIPTQIDSHLVEGAPTQPALVLGEFEHTEKAITPLYKEVRSTILSNIGALPITITGLKETDANKQVVTISMTLELDSTTPSTPNALVDVEFKKLGNGLAIETLKTVPEVFAHGSYTKSVVDLIPPELRAAVPLVETDESSPGTASTNPTLLTGELSRNEEQVNEFTKRVRIKSLGSISVPVSITATETNREKQIVSVVYTLELVGTNVVVPTALIDVQVKHLGNGYEVATIRTITEVFPGDSYTKSIVNLIPEKLRAAIALTETTIDEPGSPSTDPTLLTGEFSRTESRLTDFTKRTKISKLGDISIPVTVVDEETTEEYGGGIVNVTTTLDVHAIMSVDQGLTVVSSKLTDLHNGYDVKETKQLNGAAWPTLTGGHTFDREMQVFIDEEKQTVDPTYTPTSGTYFVESLKPIDPWRSERSKITKIPTALSVGSALVEEVDGPFQFPGLLYFNAPHTSVYVRRASAQLCQHIIRTWWLSSFTKPTRGLPGSGADVEVQDIVMDDIIGNELNDVSKLMYTGMTLHDDITWWGFFYPSTIPGVTAYGALIGTEIVVAASIEPTDIPELWKIQTKSVVAR
jgi:hypothetical protein